MNNMLKLKWVEALRYGGYRQTQGVLNNPDRTAFCCLGVLSKAVLGVTDPQRTEGSYDVIRAVVGSPHADPCGPPDVVTHLMLMNDDGFTFNEIADFIEANVTPPPTTLKETA